jgi:hypothetical protein
MQEHFAEPYVQHNVLKQQCLQMNAIFSFRHVPNSATDAGCASAVSIFSALL